MAGLAIQTKQFTVNRNGQNITVNIKYIKASKQEYSLRLSSSAIVGGLKNVQEHCRLFSGALAGIDGGIFDDGVIIGGAKDSKGNLLGAQGYDSPVIGFKDGNLIADWGVISSLKDNYDWLISASYYNFLENGQPKSDLVDPKYKTNSEVTNPRPRTMIGDSNDFYILACSYEGLLMGEQATIMLQLGCKNGFNLDGGGSRQLYDGTTFETFNTIGVRPLPTAIVVVKKSSAPQPVTGVSMFLKSSPARIRADVVNGAIKTTAPLGSYLKLINLYSWKASDGYRWGWASFNGIEGYFQYDPAVMFPVGNVADKNFHMRLTGSAARIRSSIQGTILTTVPNGSSIKILEFIGGKQADGYQWCRGVYGSTTGYFQYDPAVMFPTDD